MAAATNEKTLDIVLGGGGEYVHRGKEGRDGTKGREKIGKGEKEGRRGKRAAERKPAAKAKRIWRRAKRRELERGLS